MRDYEASQRRRRAASGPTSTPKKRVWGFKKTSSGRPNIEARSSWENATGSVQYTYQSASGRAEWLSRDPLWDAELSQGANLYWYVLNNAVNDVDPSGLTCDAPGCTTGFSSSSEAQKAGATADLAAQEADDRSGKGPEFSGLVCQCDCDKTKYCYTGPKKGQKGGPSGATTSSAPTDAPCPTGWTQVAAHYSHASGGGIPQYDKDYSKRTGLPLMLATPGQSPGNPNLTPYNSNQPPPQPRGSK